MGGIRKYKVLLIIVFSLIVVVCILSIYFLFQSRRSVRVVSTIPGVKVSLTEEKFLNDKLQEAGFWNKNTIVIFDRVNKTKFITPRSLLIELTDKPQKYDPAYSGQDAIPYQAFGFSYNEKSRELLLQVYLSPALISQFDDAGVDNRFSLLILTSIYHITTKPRLALQQQYPEEAKFRSDAYTFAKGSLQLPLKSFIHITR